jgi:hypothetical protein
MVPFNVVWKAKNFLHMSTKPTPLVIEEVQDAERVEIMQNFRGILEKVGISVIFHVNIEGILWSKVQVLLNFH